MADDAELEEGEACSDEDAAAGRDLVDRDVALSCISKKLQCILGHFEKDIEGVVSAENPGKEVSAENLGSKFDEYGSFLPIYPRSLLPFPQTRSSIKVGNISTSRSPYQQSAKSMGQNPPTVAVESIPQNNGSGAPGDLSIKGRCSSAYGNDSFAWSDSLNSSINGSDQKTLKVRIKVGSNNALIRRNTSTYGRLGLDISSPSTREESLDDLQCFSPEFSNVAFESPRAILQIMTCFSVPGGVLLSPLHGDILQLMNKVTPLLKKWETETHLDIENEPKTFEDHSETSLSLGHVSGHVANKMKPDSKKNSIDAKVRKYVDHTSATMNKGVNIERPACQEILSGTPNIEVKGSIKFAEESTKKACMSRPSEQNKEIRLHKQIGVNCLATIEEEAIKANATKYIENGNFESSETGHLVKRKVKIKASKVEAGLEERNMTNHMNSPFNRKKEIKVKPERKFEVAKVDFESNEDNKDWNVGLRDDLKKASVKEISASNRNFERDSISKHGLGPVSRSADFVDEDQKSKHKKRSRYSDGGDLMEQSMKHSKSKSKRGMDRGDHQTSKTIKIENQHHSDRYCYGEYDLTGGDIRDKTKDLVTKSKGTNSSHEQGGISLHKEKVSLRFDLLENPKRIIDEDAAFSKEKKEHPADAEILYFPAKKVAKECEGNRCNLMDHESKGSKSENFKEAKPKIMKSEEITSKVDNRPEKSRAAALDVESDPVVHKSNQCAPSREDGNGSSHFLSHGNNQSEISRRKRKSPHITNNQDTLKPIAQVIHSHKEGKAEVHSTVVKSDTPHFKTQPRQSNVKNGGQHGSVRIAISNALDTTSPVRKDGSMVAFALKEARDLKHMANHLKNKGQELESTGLYFEAALKFMHVASILEISSYDGSRRGDAAKSMKMYSETAKLCSFCARAYEQCNKMAAAALAYKCVEVAYFKVAYFKHPSTSKDQQELQAVVRLAPGEPTSSSASANLKGPGLLKAPSTKDGNSPQVAGGHLLLAGRNQANLLQLLAYTNDVSSAFDAARMSQVAIASAAVNQETEKGMDDGLVSVRSVLDLNFSNVSELLKLVRLSLESISG